MRENNDDGERKMKFSGRVKSNMAQFITGSKDIEKDWDAYVSGFKGLQLDKYLEIHQTALSNQGS